MNLIIDSVNLFPVLIMYGNIFLVQEVTLGQVNGAELYRVDFLHFQQQHRRSYGLFPQPLPEVLVGNQPHLGVDG
ncbi:MAG TPA: hypothetical protein DCE81_00460 [Cytophagales bacterium]|nr:hypothetical protein [Cytophagales bacterium]